MVVIKNILKKFSQTFYGQGINCLVNYLIIQDIVVYVVLVFFNLSHLDIVAVYIFLILFEHGHRRAHILRRKCIVKMYPCCPFWSR